MFREFVIGRNETGLVIGNASAFGGENSTLAEPILPGGNLLYYGSSSTAGTTTVPLATQQAWASFIATATAVPSSSSTGGSANSASGLGIPSFGLVGFLSVAMISMFL